MIAAENIAVDFLTGRLDDAKVIARHRKAPIPVVEPGSSDARCRGVSEEEASGAG